MRIIFGTGGTGGHLYPALALAQYIKNKEPDSEFLFVGTTNRLEAEVVPSLGIPYKGLDLQGIKGSPIEKAKAVLKFVASLGTSKKIVKQFKPDLVIGFGGYPSSSITLAGALCHVPTMIHEQNSIIGLANKILINRVDAIVCCYEKAKSEFPVDKTYLYGNPRATEVLAQEIHDVTEKYHLHPERRSVLVVMGSLGSSSVNEVMHQAMNSFATKNYDVIYVSGKAQYEEEKARYTSLPDNVHLVPYIDDMPSLLKSVDLVVSRAGASTLAEITALGVASILIPSPYVAANHQEYNARELYERDAAEMILEKELTADNLVSKIDQLLNDDEACKKMSLNAKQLGKPNACEDMYQLMKKIVKK